MVWENKDETIAGLIKDVNELQDDIDLALDVIEDLCTVMETGEEIVDSIAYGNAISFLSLRGR